ncbi:hypothetical protein A2U01_0066678, partial [Trifolium medium]|nr:hypothetical protein [Trifolium medium]
MQKLVVDATKRVEEICAARDRNNWE